MTPEELRRKIVELDREVESASAETAQWAAGVPPARPKPSFFRHWKRQVSYGFGLWVVVAIPWIAHWQLHLSRFTLGALVAACIAAFLAGLVWDFLRAERKFKREEERSKLAVQAAMAEVERLKANE